MNRYKLLSIFVLVALGGCPSVHTIEPGIAATSARMITVNVINGVITVPEDPAYLFANNGVVKWIFGSDPSGYVFPGDGIKFEPNPTPPPASIGCTSLPDPGRVFNNCKPKQNGTEFHCNKVGPHTIGACFKYTVKVQPVGGGSDIVRDPWAKNQ